MYYYEGYKTKDIAKITGLSKSNVSVSLHRARKLLKEKIERSGDYEGQICERRI